MMSSPMDMTMDNFLDTRVTQRFLEVWGLKLESTL